MAPKAKSDESEPEKEADVNPSQDKAKGNKHSKESSILDEVKDEVKKLEGEDQKLLSYFSKDELVKKMKETEEQLKSRESEVEKLKKENKDWKDKFMRLQAEFENAQKRWDKNRLNLRHECTASTLKMFLPLYDSFKKALDAEDQNTPILRGFYDQFMNIMKSFKAEPLLAKKTDRFDYNFHEALSSLERDDVPSSTIIDVIQDGWKYDKDVLRYAKVIISREPIPPTVEETAKTEPNTETTPQEQEIPAKYDKERGDKATEEKMEPKKLD
jgi:molecular chaperone GrpE